MKNQAVKSLWNANLCFLILLAVVVGGSLVLNSLYAGLPADVPHWLRTVIQYVFLFGLTLFVLMRMSGLTFADAGFRMPASPVKSFSFAIALGLLLQPPLMLVSSLSAMIFPNPLEASMSRILSDPLPLTLMASALLPAFFEEWACRGLYLGLLEEEKPLRNALLSGLVFAVLHLNLQQGAYAFCFGFVIALLAERTGSAWPAMVTHFVINATQLLLANAGVELFSGTGGLVLISLPCLFAAGALLSACGSSSPAPKTGSHTPS